MTSTKWLGTVVMVCGAFAAGGCRMDMPPGSDVHGHDASDVQPTGDDVQMTGDDVQMTGEDVQMTGEDVQMTGTDGGMTTSVTIHQLQDITDPMHPMPGARIALSQSGMVALTPRMLLGSFRGDSMGRCRFATFVGDGTAGPYSGVVVEELVDKGDASDCFSTMDRQLPHTLRAGDAITSIDNASYSEFCAGPSGTASTACRNWEQTEVFGPHTFTVGAHGSAPMAASVTTAQIGQTADGNPGPMTLAYEGVLVTLTNVQLTATPMMSDGGASFTQYTIHDSGDTAHTLQIDTSNVTHATCARTYLTAHSGMSVTVTGVLLPSFGTWQILIRDENDVGAGGTCATDGGTMDAG